jgi:hypothetical protein
MSWSRISAVGAGPARHRLSAAQGDQPASRLLWAYRLWRQGAAPRERGFDQVLQCLSGMAVFQGGGPDKAQVVLGSVLDYFTSALLAYGVQKRPQIVFCHRVSRPNGDQVGDRGGDDPRIAGHRRACNLVQLFGPHRTLGELAR